MNALFKVQEADSFIDKEHYVHYELSKWMESNLPVIVMTNRDIRHSTSDWGDKLGGPINTSINAQKVPVEKNKNIPWHPIAPLRLNRWYRGWAFWYSYIRSVLTLWVNTIILSHTYSQVRTIMNVVQIAFSLPSLLGWKTLNIWVLQVTPCSNVG